MASKTTAVNTKGNESFRRPPIVASWVDQGIGEAGMHKYIKERFGNLSSFISEWLFFDSSDNFTAYLDNNPNVRMISVMSGGMSRLLVPQHSHHATFHSAYVFCVDIERGRKAMDGEVKVKGVFNIEDDLYEQMADDLAKVLLEDGIALAKLDQRTVARQNYEEAKRLISTQANRLKDDEKKGRLAEIDGRLDQLFV